MYKMIKTFKKLSVAKAYAKKVGGVVAEHKPGYTNNRVGHLKVIRKSNQKPRVVKRSTNTTRGWTKWVKGATKKHTIWTFNKKLKKQRYNKIEIYKMPIGYSVQVTDYYNSYFNKNGTLIKKPFAYPTFQKALVVVQSFMRKHSL